MSLELISEGERIMVHEDGYLEELVTLRSDKTGSTVVLIID